MDALFAKRGPIAKFAREQVTDRDIARLRPNQWLNDEIINFYGALLLARSEEAVKANGVNGVHPVSGVKGVKGPTKKSLLNAHYFTTFFWTKLSGDGYEKGRLAKWTKKVWLYPRGVKLPAHFGPLDGYLL